MDEVTEVGLIPSPSDPLEKRSARDVPDPEPFSVFLIGDNYAVSNVPIQELTQDDIQELYDKGTRIKDMGTWLMADAMRIGNMRLADDMWNLSFGRHSYKYVRNLLWVANQWPPYYRVPGVSLSFHLVVTPLWSKAVREDNKEGMRAIRQWLADAHDRKMTREEMLADMRNFSLPPSQRTDDPLELVIRPLDEPYLIAMNKATDIRKWLMRNGGREFGPMMDDIIKTLKRAAKMAAKGYG